MELSERVKYSELFDKFNALLTQAQKQALQLYLFEDLTISEVAREIAVSRQAANDAIKKGINRLKDIDAKVDA